MHPALQTVDHRPWALPESEWDWRQSWLDLAFIHYRVEADDLVRLLPRSLKIQEFDGSAWVGIVPFKMAGVMRRPLPDLPGFSTLLELNLRTYVEFQGKPGVWFFSLDSDSWPLVFGGRHVYGLPYYPAKMKQKVLGDWHHFSSIRRVSKVGFDGRYRPVGDVFFAKPGTFEHWATERYCLYSHSSRRGFERVDVHHAPWPLQSAEAEISSCDLLPAVGIEPIDPIPVCHFSSGVHVVTFPIEKLRIIPQPII